MNIEKIIATALSVVIIFFLGKFLINEDFDVSYKQYSEMKVIEKQSPVKSESFSESEEEKKLKELKKSAESKDIKMSKLYMQKCSSCHAADTMGVQGLGSKLFGQSESELVKKLKDYKEGRAENQLMVGILKNSTDEELAGLAKEISSLK